MEQCRNSLAGRYGKRASSSGGASPLPLFHFLFLLLDRGELGHRLPPGPPVGHRHGYCIRLVLELPDEPPTSFCDQTFFRNTKRIKRTIRTNVKGGKKKKKNAGRASTQKHELFISVFNTLYLQDKKKKKKADLTSCIGEFPLN